MPLSRRHLLVATVASVAAPIRAQTQTPRAPQVGKDYMVLKKPVPTDSGAKVEVLEFFQYSCPHCFAYDPFLTTWRKKLPPDVEYKRIPIAWDNSTMPHVRIYYTLEALGKLPEMHEKIFAAIQKNKQPLLDPDQIAEFMAANGIDRKQWIDTYNSFSIAARANRAGQIWRAYNVDGTPMMGVDGKFTTAPSMVGSREGSLIVLDYLVQQARAEHGKK
ncbi:MAG TPA: thiol:disulfide interchange protein DsbA/DsbL [Burkholderiaceae bacterium]|nr:thiol:disulfide interchange protein DsbA/DsbL [Burkholderiaceae bacterium]